uniref:Uncharacterized protein n=1 Tax=Loa loa TaxID=7209 RepID=A0A1I7VWI6_LOALO
MAPVTYSTGQENLKPKIAFWELLSWSKTPPLPNSKIFRQERDSLKTIYMHPRSQHWHITDSVLVCQRTHVMSSAERRTDHPLYDVNSTWALNPNLREALKLRINKPINHVKSSPLSADGQTLLTNKNSILDRWSGHFQTPFSANRASQGSVIQHITQQPVKSELDITRSTTETLKVIQ